jgi:hypothetical protein
MRCPRKAEGQALRLRGIRFHRKWRLDPQGGLAGTLDEWSSPLDHEAWRALWSANEPLSVSDSGECQS